MSRFGGDGDYEPVIDKRGREINTAGLWQGALKAALHSKRGRQALTDLREALMALPERRLIAGALCTVGLAERIEAMPATVVREITPYSRDENGKATFGPPTPTEVKNYERQSLIEFVDENFDQPEGVCAVGAYVWWQKVKAGMDPATAFAELPVLPDTDSGEWETAEAGRDAGLTERLAYHLAYLNDESLEGVTPEERWQRVVDHIDKVLAEPALGRRR